MTFRITVFFSVLITIALIHIVSSEFYLYWKYLWLDVPMHILGGIAVALGFSLLPFFRIRLKQCYTTRIWYVSVVFAVGVFWELFEFFAGISIHEPGFVLDTTTDLIFDTVGALLGYGLVRVSDRL